LEDDKYSKRLIKGVKKNGYDVRTKPVKIIKIPINTSSINKQSPDLLKNFIRPTLLNKLDIQTIKLLNEKLRDLNKQKIFYLEDKKCNFDVEIGTDILVDHKSNGIDTFILWSGDSDFSDTVAQLLKDGKEVVLFASARFVASELNKLKEKGLYIYDIKKIKKFICWKREINS
jgi:uncharacterized LabA/DUF88 family protein